MNKKKLIKDIIIFLILTFILIIASFGHKIENESIFKNIIITISTFLSGLMVFGLYSYVGFKIIKGKEFVYKDPHKGKKLENIDVGESISRWRYFRDYKISSSLFDWFC